MILTRLGNKSAIADKITPYFPTHQIYIEPFFGAGGMFFNKPKAKYNIVNDLDSDVFNLFQVVSNRKNDFIEQFKLMPLHIDLLEYWKNNTETDEVKKALRFIFLSNMTYLGKQDTLAFKAGDLKGYLLSNLDEVGKTLFDVQFGNSDFRKFLNSLSFRGETEIVRAFIYADPPYLNQTSTYTDNGWTESDSTDLFNGLSEIGCKWAMSEFDHPFILQQAKERNLNVHIIGERQNMKNRKTEVLITNYVSHATLF